MNNFLKGAKMALPFIAGLAVGAGVIVAYNKRDIIKDKLANSLEKSKDIAQNVKEFTKKTALDVKEFIDDKAKSAKKRAPKNTAKKTSKKQGINNA